MNEQGARRRDLVKGNAYFIVLNEGQVYQGEYCGWHEQSQCYWFKPLPFSVATDGPQWVFFRQVRVMRDLGAPITGHEFETAIEGLLE